MDTKIEKLLSNHELRKTPFRRQVLSIFMSSKSSAISSQEIEAELTSSDRVTLYRTLKTFEKKGLIHQVVDGTGVFKYAICQEHSCSADAHNDEHAHFHCNECEETVCLENIDLPEIKAPSGYIINNAHVILNGICRNCS